MGTDVRLRDSNLEHRQGKVLVWQGIHGVFLIPKVLDTPKNWAFSFHKKLLNLCLPTFD